MAQRPPPMRGAARALSDWLPECNSIRRGRGWAEPEIWFRILHVAFDGHDGAPVAAYREQTVEIAGGGPMGPSKTATSAP